MARIHVLAKQLGLDRDTYEDLLWCQGRVRSSKDLDAHGRSVVIRHLQMLADKAGLSRRKPQTIKAASTKAQKKNVYPGRPHNTDAKRRREMTKIEAQLTDAKLPWAYAEAMAKHMYRKERLEFCAPWELAGIVTALDKKALKRLHKEMESTFGKQWEDLAAYFAYSLFDFPALTWDISKNSQAMSQVLRWWNGEITANCPWPVTEQNRAQACRHCVYVAQSRGQID